MTRKQTTPRRLQRLPQLGKTLPNAYLDIKTMMNFFENTDKAAVMPRDSTSNLFLSLPGFSGTIIRSFSPPTNRAPKQFFNKITHENVLRRGNGRQQLLLNTTVQYCTTLLVYSCCNALHETMISSTSSACMLLDGASYTRLCLLCPLLLYSFYCFSFST